MIPRGAVLTHGATADALAAQIEKNIFFHGRLLLRRWREETERMFGAGSWTRLGGPEPESLGLHRLSEQTVIMGDNCNGAEATKQRLIAMAEAAGREAIGEDRWAELSKEEQNAAVKAHAGHCQGHARNTYIELLTRGGELDLTEELGDELKAFAACTERVSVKVTDVIRTASKCLHPQCIIILG